MDDTTLSRTSNRSSQVFSNAVPLPAVLVAFAPMDAVTVDRCQVTDAFTEGRGSGADFPIRDEKVSKKHCKISQSSEGFEIADLGSTNGTSVNGLPLRGTQPLENQSVIRIGRAVLVFWTDARELLDPPPVERFGMAGHFHTGPLLREIREAAVSNRHDLLTGPSGSGKELAARAIATMLRKGDLPTPYIDYNAARFASEDEAVTTLFGAGEKVFTGVKSRPGLIELADGGVLFLDEVHNLPVRVQRSLLKVMEGGRVQRVGESRDRKADVQFVLASNESGPTFGLAQDLFNRLRVVHVPSLAERTADVPAIFQKVLSAALAKHGIETSVVLPLLSGDHCEAPCLDRFEKDNVRGVIDISDRLATRISVGTEPSQAWIEIFNRRFAQSPVAARQKGETTETGRGSRYETHRDQIIAAFHESNRVLTATERLLNAKGIRCSRRWLSIYLKNWGELS